MSKEVFLILGGIVSVCISTALTYYFTKKREREAQWRAEKMKYYVEYVNSLSGIVIGDSTEEGQKRFSKACNDIQLFAPKDVILAMQEFRVLIQGQFSQEEHDFRLTQLLYAMRSDLNIKPKDKKGDWEARLWSSGNKKGTM